MKLLRSKKGISVLDVTVALLIAGGVYLGVTPVVKSSVEDANNSSIEHSSIVKDKIKVFDVSTAKFPDGKSQIPCKDTDSQIANAYLLSYYVDEYQANHPTEEIPKLLAKYGEISVLEETSFTKSNEFKNFAQASSCHAVKLEPQGTKNFIVSMKSNNGNANSSSKNTSNDKTNAQWVTVYDSSSNDSRKILMQMAKNSK